MDIQQHIFTVNEFLFLLKTIKITQMFYPSSKGLFFHRVETILALMNVLTYVKCFIDHTNN